MVNSIEKTNTDNILYIMIRKAMDLEEGMLTGESAKSLFGCSTDGQFKWFLKPQKHLPFEVSPTGDVIPQFTKHEIIRHLEKEYLEQRIKYIFLEPIDPEGLL